jgi:hypothetical protein
MCSLLRTRAFPLLLAAGLLVTLAGCGGGYGYGYVVDTGSVEAENATDDLLPFPYAMMDFSIWFAGDVPSGINYLSFPLAPGEAEYIGEFDPDWYDADALMESVIDDYLETWFDVPVDSGLTSVFTAY